MKHIHAELMKQWAEDTSLVIECLNNDGVWQEVTQPRWHPDCEYRIKPAELKKVKLLAWFDGLALMWRNELHEMPADCQRVPSEDKEVVLP